MQDALRERLNSLPRSPGVYLMKNATGKVLYVGKAVVLRNRVRSYFQKQSALAEKVRHMVAQVADIDWIVTDSELEALILELNLIKKHKPRYNVRLRDDKHYPYLCITTSERYPAVILTRRAKQDGNLYFGPYAESKAAWRTLRLVRRLFRLQPCGRRQDGERRPRRPCMYHYMGQCLGACTGQADPEEYRKAAKEAALFLQGRQERILKSLEREMQQAAEAEQFERAAHLRDEISAVRTVIEKQKVISTALSDEDVIAIVSDDGNAVVQMFFIRGGRLLGQEHFLLEGASSDTLQESVSGFIKQYYSDSSYVPREILTQVEAEESGIISEWLRQKRGSHVLLHTPKRGEKRKLLEMAEKNAALVLEEIKRKLDADEESVRGLLADAQETLGLDRYPARIEAFDISNTQAHEIVGSMVVFENGRPQKTGYRRFKVRTVEERPDDYASMQEVVRRRLDAAERGDAKFAEAPDLMLIDGGKGHLHAVLEVLTERGQEFPVASLAKQLEEIHVPDRAEPIRLPRNSRVLQLLQRVRDEAHRFAITYHRQLRSRTVRSSALDEIPGIGEKRRQALLNHFGSMKRVREASLDELASVPAMSRKAAEILYGRLHGADAKFED